MPAKRVLYLRDKENTTPAKRRALERNYSPLTGTRSISLTESPQVRRKTDNPYKTQNPQTDTEKLHALRSKVEVSASTFKKAKARIEKALPTEGSSTLGCFFRRASADLLEELRKNRELGAMVESCRRGTDSVQYRTQGPENSGSSYEFLKSILG